MASDLAPLTENEHRTGDVIAERYELRHRVGEGGMGFVWVARSRALDVDVALKLLRPEIAGAEAIERMAREARTAAQLGHPAMVRVLDFGRSERGEPFLAMELLQGEELHTLLAREKILSPERAAALLLPIIDGLGMAHEKGIVHRDIKPENIFIADEGQGRIQPKVLDFGIAKLGQAEMSTRLTKVGAVLGSPSYLSPEQAEGLDDVDHRSDVWSVGVLLYELVTGAPPFVGANYNALIRRILRDPPKPTTELGVADAQFWTILERCLKKDPGERWSSMWELGESLALWLFEHGVRVDAAARSLRHGWLEGRVTGLQILVPSEPPDDATPPPTANMEVISGPLPPSPTVATPSQSPAKSRKNVQLALLVGLAAITVALLFFARSRPVASIHPAAEERGLAAVSGNVVPSASTIVAAPVAARPDASDTPAQAVPVAPVASARQAPRSLPTVPRAAPVPKRAPRPAINKEFGF
jgi:eukaryotic-like serine/threonine-protein kinase